ncbi:MAG: hypothetical protein R3F20_11725 [Planctomycetota bacterium]
MSRIALAFVAALTLAFVATPAQAQLTNPSFTSGFPSPAGWTIESGTITSAFFSDAGMPTDPFFYLSVSSQGTGGAMPHSNPGGFGTDASATAAISQAFTVPSPTQTLLTFDCVLVTANVGEADFLEVSISDGTSVYNAVHLDTSTVVGGATPILNASVDLGAVFPNATATTVFTIRMHVGDLSGLSVSKGYFDNFQHLVGTPFDFNRVDFVNMGAVQQVQMHTTTPVTRCWHFISGNVSGPVGGGEVFGLYPDPLIFEILGYPLGTPGLHVLTNGAGNYTINVPTPAIPSGDTFDFMIVVFDGAGNVTDITTPKRYVWP